MKPSQFVTLYVHNMCNIDYCNSMYYYRPQTQLNRLQHIQNALRLLVLLLQQLPKSSNSDHILTSLHWLKLQEVQERIEYNLL